MIIFSLAILSDMTFFAFETYLNLLGTIIYPADIYAGITCAYSVNRGALCGLQRNLIQNLHVLLMCMR